MINNQPDFARKIFAVAILSLLYAFMFGCQASSELSPPISSVTHTPAATFLPNSTAIYTPTIQEIPSLVSTPGPEFLLEGPPSSISYTIPLTIQYLTKNSATLFFEIESPADGYLFYWPYDAQPSEGRWIELSDDSTRQLITLQDLEQDEDYFAAVGLLGQGGGYQSPEFGEELWEPIRVRPLDMNQEGLRIGVIGDSGFGDQVTKKLAARILDQDLDMLIHTGDIVYRADENTSPQAAYAEKFYKPFAQVLHNMPIYPVIGNHEYDSAVRWLDRPYYAYAFPPFLSSQESQIDSEKFRQYYALEIGSLQFLFLDSQAFWTGAGSGDQNSWLQQRLENNPYAATIVVLHVAPYTSGLHSDDGKILRQKWIPLFEQSNVIMVISGHDHNYERLQANGITYIVSGGGSAVLYALKERLAQSEIFRPQSHFLVLTLGGNGISVVAIDVDGMILDTFRLQLPT